MTSDVSEKLRDKDQVVLQHIGQGNDDVQKITAATTLENHHVTYSFQKLEELGLIEVEKPDRMIERVVGGQKRVFQHPKQAKLIKKGEEYLEEKEVKQYKDMSRAELVKKVNKLEDEVDDLRKSIQLFKKQVQEKL